MPAMQQRYDTGLPFMKMHGLGNDFVIVDARAQATPIRAALAKGIGHRQFGVGFDQLAVIENRAADAHLVFYNADGSQSAACGNATRCIAAWELAHRDSDTLQIAVTGRGMLHAVRNADGSTAVNMGHPQLDWQDVPLAQDVDMLHLPIDGQPVATGMGNPHCTFFVDDVMAIDLTAIGPQIEHHPLYPERTNVQFAQVIGPDHIRMRVWERGTGITLASGSSSCATAVAAARRGLTGRTVQIDLDGGTLHIDWRDDGVWMSGPTAHVFDGRLTVEFLNSL